MPSALTDRIDHLRFILRESKWGLVLLFGWLAFGLFLLIRGVLFSAALPVVSGISFDFWISTFILLFLVAAVEGSYQTNSDLREKLSGLEDEHARRYTNQAIQDALSSFATQGAELLRLCADESKPVPVQPVVEWNEKVEDYLRRKLEPSFSAHFKTCSPLPTLLTRPGLRDEYSTALKTKMSVLHEFVRSLRDRI
jgi:hypothetical protein